MTSRLSKWLMVATMSVVVVGFGTGYGQEPTTPQETSPKVTNSKPQQKRSKSTPKTTPDTTSTAETTGDQTTTVAAQPTATVVTAPTEQTDLSGTYAGTFTCDELGLTGDTTLTVTGNQFTTAAGKSGRIVASTTKGYTAVALQMGGEAGATPMIVSLRGRKAGDKLTLTSVDAAAHPCSFAPTRAIASQRTRRTVPVAPAAAVGTEVANPADAGPSPADIIGAPARKARKTKTAAPKATTTMLPPLAVPTESPATIPVPTQSPEPESSQTPRPNPRPIPSPSPSASPSPTPEPSPSPTPSPSPSPSPAPKRP